MNEWLECEVDDCTTTDLVQLQVCRQVYKVLPSSKYKIVFINKSSYVTSAYAVTVFMKFYQLRDAHHYKHQNIIQLTCT